MSKIRNFNKFVAPVNSANKAFGFLLIVIAIAVSAYISVMIWIEKRTLFEKLTYEPVAEETALEQAVPFKTMNATELQVVSGSDEKTITVKAGTEIKLLGVYMTRLNYRSDSHYKASPSNFTPDQYFFIELPNGARGAAVLPELADHWDEYGCLNNNGQTVVYTCPLAGVPVDKQHKVASVPRFMKIPTHDDNGFFLFPRFKSWNMFKMGFWWRGRFMLGIYWFLLLVIVLWRLTAYSVRLCVRISRRFTENPSLSSEDVYKKSVRYYWSHYYPVAFLVGCIFTPLVWLWSKMNRSAMMSGLMTELRDERCPKCRKLGLGFKFSGNVTPYRSLGTTYFDGRTYEHEDYDYSDRVWDPVKEEFRGRKKRITVSFAPGSYEVFEREKEWMCYCEKCGSVLQKGWEKERKTDNYKGGELLYERTSKEPVAFGYVKR